MRVGSIEFINSLPVDFGWLSGAVSLKAEAVSGSPRALNQKIKDGEIQISPVSSFFYAQNAASFYILPNLSISSLSGVESVLLMSKKPIGELKETPILLTAKGQTTPSLLQILCQKKYGFRPILDPPDKARLANLAKEEAFLVIGDDALLWSDRAKQYDFIKTDLAVEWNSWTALPIVFALWAVRRDFFGANAGQVNAAHRALMESKRFGLENPSAIRAEAARKISLKEDALRKYFSLLSYDLNDEAQKGLELYFQYCHECGLVDQKPEIQFMPSEVVSA